MNRNGNDKLKLEAIELDLEGRCLICKEEHEKRTRGLCLKHYTQYTRKRNKIPKEHREKFDQRLIDAGFLLEPKRPGRAVEEDVFAEFAEDLLAPKSGSAAQDGIDRYERDKGRIRKRVAQTKAKKAAKKKPDSDKGTGNGAG